MMERNLDNIDKRHKPSLFASVDEFNLADQTTERRSLKVNQIIVELDKPN